VRYTGKVERREASQPHAPLEQPLTKIGATREDEFI